MLLLLLLIAFVIITPMMSISHCNNGDMSKHLLFMKVVVKLGFIIIFYHCHLYIQYYYYHYHYGVVLLTINIIVIIHIIIVIIDIVYAYFNVSWYQVLSLKLLQQFAFVWLLIEIFRKKCLKVTKKLVMIILLLISLSYWVLNIIVNF